MIENLKQNLKIEMRPLTPRPLLEEEGTTFQLFNRSTIQRVKAYAFTLAEVLIVIGIIGVVAALTLPNLNHATGDKEKVTKVKKIYSTLTEAVDRAQAIYGPFNTWFNDCVERTSCNERFAKRVTEFMKVSKNCEFNEGCFSSAPLLLSDGDEYTDNYLDSLQQAFAYMVTLSDGMSLRFIYQPTSSSFPSNIGVDIDGPQKGKNQDGNDIFNFSIYTDESSANSVGANVNQLIPSACPDTWIEDNIKYYVTAWVIENGNLDYLKCLNELNWETKTSCE